MQLAVGKGGGGGLPKAIFPLWGVLQNERYDGGPLTSACTLHANCASHPQLSYFWLSRTGKDGAAKAHHVRKKRNHGEIAAGVHFFSFLALYLLDCKITHPV